MQLNFSDITGEEPIWVLNSSRGNNRGPVMFAVVEKNTADMRMVTVPDTFLPINLVEKASIEQLQSSHNLREGVECGLLRLIDGNEASRLMSMPGAAKEKRRLDQAALEQEATTTDRLASNQALSPQELQRDLPPELAEALPERLEYAPSPADMVPDNLHTRVRRVIAMINSEDEVDLINMLRAIEADLTVNDLKQVYRIAKDSNKKRMASWARGQVNKRSGKTTKKTKTRSRRVRV